MMFVQLTRRPAAEEMFRVVALDTEPLLYVGGTTKRSFAALNFILSEDNESALLWTPDAPRAPACAGFLRQLQAFGFEPTALDTIIQMVHVVHHLVVFPHALSWPFLSRALKVRAVF